MFIYGECDFGELNVKQVFWVPPESKNMQYRLIGNTKLSVSVNVCVCVCVCVCERVGERPGNLKWLMNEYCYFCYAVLCFSSYSCKYDDAKNKGLEKKKN